MNAPAGPFRSETANRLLAEGRLPSVPRSARPSAPTAETSALRQWHSAVLAEAYHAVLSEGLKRNWQDPVWQKIYRPLVDRIEKADIALARAAAKGGRHD